MKTLLFDMRYLALASDYDGTIAEYGTLRPETITALKRLRQSGRKLILVTGRELPELQSVCSSIDLFDLIVVENGAVLFDPRTSEETLLAESPPAAFGRSLRAAGVTPLSIARVMISTREDQQEVVLDLIERAGVDLWTICNRGSMLILPNGVDKASGLAHALERLGLSRCDVVGVGDGENDHALLETCGCGVAVANALPPLKELAHFVTSAEAGDGVAELIEMMLSTDLEEVVLEA